MPNRGHGWHGGHQGYRAGSIAVLTCVLIGLAAVTCKGGHATVGPDGLVMHGVVERTALLDSLSLDETERTRVLATFTVTDDFPGDLGRRQELRLPLATPPAGAENGAVLALARAETFAVLDQVTRPRFVAPAIYEANGTLTVYADVVARYVDDDRRIHRAAGNQAGTYLLLAPPAGEALQLVAGTTVLTRPGSLASHGTPWDGATVSVSSSPLLAVSGTTGKFLTAGLAGRTTLVAAIRTGAREAPLATPAGAARLIAPAEARAATLEGLADRAERVGDPELAGILATEVDEASGRAMLLMERLPLVETRLVFEVPKTGPSFPLTDDRDPPARPTPDLPAEDLPEVGHPTLRVDLPDAPQLDLGCSGFGGLGDTLEFVRSGSDVAAGQRGWRARGDARYAYDAAALIFGAPASLGDLYLDNVPGYCVITTGDGQAARAYGDLAYMPGPDGRGLASDLAQRVLVPAAAKSIQVRFSILTQEYPDFHERPGGDALYVRFDESPAALAQASLAELAADEAFVDLPEALPPFLWDIGSSTSAAPGGYTGYLPPRLLCRDLDEQREAGHVLTLRIGIADGGDRLLDTALLVDAVAFGTESCANPAGRMTADPVHLGP